MPGNQKMAKNGHAKPISKAGNQRTRPVNGQIDLLHELM